MKLIRAGRVLGGFGSPPCSTVLAARRVPLSSRGGPRPLRPRAEKLAVSVGSALFLLVLGFFGEIATRGGWVGLEHPADRGQEPFPSFFATAETAAFKKLAKLTYVVTHQCMFGAATKKPTGLLVHSGCDSIVQHCSHSRRHPVLRGLAAGGTFHTTPAARYPGLFCHALSKLFIQRVIIARKRQKNTIAGQFVAVGNKRLWILGLA